MNFQVKENAVIHNNTSNFIATVIKCMFFFTWSKRPTKSRVPEIQESETVFIFCSVPNPRLEMM